MSDLVTATEFKSYANIAHTDDDTLIGGLIGYVTAAIERYCHHVFTEAEVTEYHNGGDQDLIVDKRPIASIDSIVDTFDDDAEVDSGDYDFDPDAGLIYLSYSTGSDCSPKWAKGRRRWKVVYTGGDDGAPDDVKLAALQLIQSIYDSRNRDMQSESLGDYSYSRYANMLQPGSWAPDIIAALSQYRDIVL